MKQPPASYLYHQQQQEEMEEAVAVTVGMEVDDADPIEILSDFDRQQPPVDADFFNSFDDDFDDQDLALMYYRSVMPQLSWCEVEIRNGSDTRIHLDDQDGDDDDDDDSIVRMHLILSCGCKMGVIEQPPNQMFDKLTCRMECIMLFQETVIVLGEEVDETSSRANTWHPMNGLAICLLQMLQPHKFSTGRLGAPLLYNYPSFRLLRLAFLAVRQFCSLVLPQVTSSATSSFMATSSPPRTDAANLAIVVERDPPKRRFLELGIRSWPKRVHNSTVKLISGSMLFLRDK
ncbi:hypothetical protein MUK42_04890 [Musa troglodytarum]|uniref:Uncharacterized protein n=1 Tax=Musa troglodytarum TaxID=320322 RepID=A0A9E7KC37_9LILI|nr:hypothetical protein MUK42_04890 [Musa troglodytarum]